MKTLLHGASCQTLFRRVRSKYRLAEIMKLEARYGQILLCAVDIYLVFRIVNPPHSLRDTQI